MKLLYIVLFVSAVGCCSAADTKEVNEVMDQLVVSLKKTIKMGKMDAVEIPVMKGKFDYNSQKVNWRGKFKCHGDVVKSLESLKRTGDSNLITDGSRTILTVPLAFEKLNFNFKTCKFEAPHLNATTPMKVEVTSNSVELQVVLTKEGEKCDATVGHIKIDNYEKIKIVNLPTQIRILEKLLKKSAISYFHDKILPIVEVKLTEASKTALSKPNNICSKILPPSQ